VVTTLAVRDLDFAYGGDEGPVPALAGIDLELAAGEMLAVLGPNGAGKSTLLRILAGLLAPTRGAVELEGQALGRWRPRERARRLALVPQNPTALPDVSVEAFAGYGRYSRSHLFRGPSAEDREAVRAALEQADLADLGPRPLAELSGGQRQRALIARALAQEARILLVDEPTNALDPGHQLRVLDLLADLAAAGRTVVVVTHELNLASQFAQRALLLDAGRTVACAPVQEVLVPAVLGPVYGSELHFGELPAARGNGPRPFVLPWRKPGGEGKPGAG